jgi:hypothetical protein
MLDQNATHLTLRHLDMPANFFSSSNSVAESGNLSSNLLLGVSTPGNDIVFRRQMQSRLGEPITAAGNPPVRFASADFEAEFETRRLPSFSLFLTRVFLNDIFSIGFLPIAELIAYVIIFTVLQFLDVHLLASVVIALLLTELVLISASVAVKRLLVGGSWGIADSAPFWSWRHFSYFFAQDCFFAWGRLSMGITAGTLLSNIFLRWMGCRIGKRTIVSAPLQAFDWNAVSIGDNCIINGLLQFHSFENMTLRVKQSKIQNGSVVNFGATVMGGVVIKPKTTILPLSLVLKEMILPTGIYEGSPAELVTILPNSPQRLLVSNVQNK